MSSESDSKKEYKLESKELKLEKKRIELKFKTLKAKELEAKQLKTLQKQKVDQENSSGLFGTTSEPRKSLSVYLRNQNKAEVSFVSILDRKAAILIRISTTLVSGLVVFYSYIVENVSHGVLISSIAMIGLLITLILAIIATKPVGKIMQIIFKKILFKGKPNTEENVFFFNPDISMEEYQEAMVKVVNSQDLQIGNQVRANYILAAHNSMKSKILDFSYSIFLGTIVVVGLVTIFPI